jgi:hypothetical protein
MRRGWNGITISRDTIHIEGIRLGFTKPVFFERHAVGGEVSCYCTKMERKLLFLKFKELFCDMTVRSWMGQRWSWAFDDK